MLLLLLQVSPHSVADADAPLAVPNAAVAVPTAAVADAPVSPFSSV